MPELTSGERRALRARAHHLQPVVIIGEAGVTPPIVREIDLALTSHELIKVRVLGDDRQAREGLIVQICQALNASPVQHIGKILVLYRPRPEESAPPRRSGRKGRYRPKRSFQHEK
jgi:RNA-binding protein